jgi:circadian clock protein KaiB
MNTPDLSAARYLLRLFVTGSTLKSGRAIQDVRAMCDENLFGRSDLEVIDIHQHPEHASAEKIVAAPTLLRKLPLPVCRVVGDMSDKERVLAALQIERVE